MRVKQLIYLSIMAPHTDSSCLRDILRESLARNPQLHITGMLLHINGSFLQLLEGMPDQVDQLYQGKIRRDPRHVHVHTVLEQQLDEPQFQDWSMGFAEVPAAELDVMAQKNDFFTSGHCFTELSNTETGRILAEFRQGEWRGRLA